jgi:chromate transporter
MLPELVIRFVIVGALAFGGGQAALPLVERMAVAETGWLTPTEFATGIGLSYATPGPVLILAAFVGYRVAAVPGALAAVGAVFAVPVILAGIAAQLAARMRDQRWFGAFGRFAAAAAIGLLGVTLLALARPLIDLHPALLIGAAGVFGAERLGVHPVILIAGTTLLGAALSLFGWL